MKETKIFLSQYNLFSLGILTQPASERASSVFHLKNFLPRKNLGKSKQHF